MSAKKEITKYILEIPLESWEIDYNGVFYKTEKYRIVINCYKKVEIIIFSALNPENLADGLIVTFSFSRFSRIYGLWKKLKKIQKENKIKMKEKKLEKVYNDILRGDM